MDTRQLEAILANGESSGTEFKRDDAHTDSLAKEIVALANFRGGCVLPGVEDDGTVTGLRRDPRDVEE